MLGIHQLDEGLGLQMMDLIQKYFGLYQDEIKAMINTLEGMAQKHDQHDCGIMSYFLTCSLCRRESVPNGLVVTNLTHTN